jgi:hypothetical protein
MRAVCIKRFQYGQKLLYFGCWERSRLNLFDFLLLANVIEWEWHAKDFENCLLLKSDSILLCARSLICIRQGPFTLAIFAAISSAIFVFWWMWRSGWVINAHMKEHVLRTFITYPLVLIHQKKNIAQEIATQIASVKVHTHRTRFDNATRFFDFHWPITLILV